MDIPFPRRDEEAGGPLWNNIRNAQLAKYDLENKGVQNAFMRPMAEQNLLAQKLKNQFTPLDMAIRAQNALVYNNRFGNIGMYLRSIGEMPAAERSAYLAQPENYNFYNNMLEQFKYGMKNPQSQGNILTPEYVASFGIGTQNQNNLPQTYENGGMPQNALRGMGMPQGLPGGGMTQGMGVPPVAPGSPQPPTDLTISPQQAQKLAQAPQNMWDAAQAAKMAQSSEVQVPERDQARLNYLQLLVNQKAVPASLKERLSNVVSMESWLMQNKDEYVRLVESSSEYFGPTGKLKYWRDVITGRNQDKVKDYNVLTQSIIPELTSLNNRIGKLGATDKQRAESRGIVNQITNWQLRPGKALRAFNDQLNMVRSVGNSVVDANEPIFKGVNKQIYNFNLEKQNYIPNEVIQRVEQKANGAYKTQQPFENTPQLQAPPGKILVEYQGRKGYLPADKWGKELEAKGYRRIS